MSHLAENSDSASFGPQSVACCDAPARCLLYVDDDWSHLTSQRAMLEAAGYRVVATDSPAAGLSSYVRDGLDAVILDFHLPFVSNNLLATVMHRLRTDIPLILIATQSDPASEDLGAFDRLISRDLPPGALLENVHDVIEHGRERTSAPVVGATASPTGKLTREVGHETGRWE